MPTCLTGCDVQALGLFPCLLDEARWRKPELWADVHATAFLSFPVLSTHSPPRKITDISQSAGQGLCILVFSDWLVIDWHALWFCLLTQVLNILDHVSFQGWGSRCAPYLSSATHESWTWESGASLWTVSCWEEVRLSSLTQQHIQSRRPQTEIQSTKVQRPLKSGSLASRPYRPTLKSFQIWCKWRWRWWW